jgi:hypothetical protein
MAHCKPLIHTPSQAHIAVSLADANCHLSSNDHACVANAPSVAHASALTHKDAHFKAQNHGVTAIIPACLPTSCHTQNDLGARVLISQYNFSFHFAYHISSNCQVIPSFFLTLYHKSMTPCDAQATHHPILVRASTHAPL